MIALQEPQVYRVRVLITRTILAFVLVNQFALLSSWIAGGNLIAETIHQSFARSAFQSKDMSPTSSTINQPIIFVHGLFQDARLMGIPQKNPADNAFVPLYRELNRDYGSVQTFWYLDDVGYSDGIDKTSHCPQQYGVCLSQSSIIDNAARLDQMISSLYTSSHHKVALIGYSMGAAIIRTALTGCPQTVTCQANLNANIAELVNDVFFITGVQQGSWVAKDVTSVQKDIDPGVSLLATYQPALKTKWGLTKKAAAELAPQSANILLHNSSDPPHHIHYFNFYGDIQFSWESCFAAFCVPGKSAPIGDGILLPGSDDPKATPLDGGARFCLQCNGKNFSQIDADTSYTQWPLRGEVSIDSTALANCTDLGCVLAELSPLYTAPQMHVNLPSDESLDGTAIQVQDTTGMSGSKTTSIAKEIALQLEAMPPTQTSCPTSGTARAAITAPLVLGQHQNIIYVYNQTDTNGNPTSAFLKRYDVTTGGKTIIAQLPNTTITETQISTDRQWVLFLAQTTIQVQGTKLTQSEIQMVRVDGQGLQTLDCSSPSPTQEFGYRGTAFSDIRWSPDQKTLLFDDWGKGGYNQPASMYLLSLSTGVLQKELLPIIPAVRNPTTFLSRAWLDNTRVYVVDLMLGNDFPVSTLYLLDTSKGANQQSSDLQVVTKLDIVNQENYAISPDRTKLFLYHCSCGLPVGKGPSSVTVQPATGGTPQTIYTNQTFAVTQVKPISSTSILLDINNYGLDQTTLQPVDTSQNGIWEMNIDGSGLTRLTTQAADISDASPDGAFISYREFSSTNSETIYFLSLRTNTAISFASTQPTQGYDRFLTLTIAGWTMM